MHVGSNMSGLIRARLQKARGSYLTAKLTGVEKSEYEKDLGKLDP